MRQHLEAHEQNILEQLKTHLKNTDHIHDMVKWLRKRGKRDFKIPPPVSPAIIEQAEKDLGFPLPPLFREIYLQIADGGFGPGYGLYRLIGHPQDFEAIVPQYFAATDPKTPEPYNTWHPRHLFLVEWGCNIYSIIDCSTADGAIYRYRLDMHDEEPLRDYGIIEASSLSKWLERWLRGEDLFRDYDKRD